MSKKVSHLVRKGNRFYFRIRVPQALSEAFYGGKSEVTKALGNVSQAQAAILARDLAARFSSEFLSHLHGLGLAANPPIADGPVRTATHEEARYVSRSDARSLLALDEEARLHGMDDGGADWNTHMAQLAAEAASNIAGGHVGALRQRIGAALAMRGLELPKDALEARRMIRGWAAEQSKATRAALARSAGEIVETPPQEPIPASLQEGASTSIDKLPATALKLRHVLELWKVAKRDRPLKTIQKAEKSVALFEELTGNPPLASLTRADGATYKTKLIDRDISEKTARDRLEWVQILLNFEATEYGRLPKNPWKGIAIAAKAKTVREEWKEGEVAALFSDPIFQVYALPSVKSAGGPAAYWVPLIGAFTGARVTEIAQLLVDDVYVEDGQWYFRFEDRLEWQKLKNKSSRRRIPIHPELIRLGLVEHVDAMRAAKEERLFPLLAVSKLNNAGGGFSSWFGKFKKRAGFSKANTFHGWRNTIETKLLRAREGDLHIKKYLGHAPEGIGQQTYARLQPHDLIETAEKIRYEGLSLPRVYRRESAATVSVPPQKRAPVRASRKLRG